MLAQVQHLQGALVDSQEELERSLQLLLMREEEVRALEAALRAVT